MAAALERPALRQHAMPIDVAVTSEEIDREKGLLYAEVGVPEYRLVLAGQRRIEVHTEPSAAGWGRVRVVEASGTITATSLPGVTVAMSDLFPA